MLLSLRKNGLTSLFKEVRVFKVLHLMPHQNGMCHQAHQMKNLCGSLFSKGHLGRHPGKMKNGAPRDELKNGRGRGWAVPCNYEFRSRYGYRHKLFWNYHSNKNLSRLKEIMEAINSAYIGRL